MNCKKCHTCGTELRIVLDGEEWCPKCKTYRRYRSHGFNSGELSKCIQTRINCAENAFSVKQNYEKNIKIFGDLLS